ncbi:NAD-dependent protein deacylase [bacterium]|nr:NAD-dependent protein deacylase [bacterium]
MNEHLRQKIADLARRCHDGARVAVLSGAGISAASGIPTFRGGSDDALWSRYRPEQLATPEAFERDPELVWRWYDWRRGLIADAAPNEAHHALVELATITDVRVITQNVDGYHQQAGSQDVIEYHGNIWTVRCTSCHFEDLDHRVPIPIPPRCPRCHELVRPAVVWFGEGIPTEAAAEAEKVAAACDILLVVGTAGAVYPAAGLVTVAGVNQATIAEFNLEPSAITQRADLYVPGSAAETLPLLLETPA